MFWKSTPHRSAVNRRLFLGGAAAAVLLPSFPSLLSAEESPAIRRYVFALTPNGMPPDHWLVSGEGGSLELPPMMSDLEPFRDRVTVIRGHSKDNGVSGHFASSAAHLTGMRATHGGRGSASKGPSVDHLLAQLQSTQAPLSTLELQWAGARGEFTPVSWREAGVAPARLSDPLAIFNRLFAGADPQATGEERTRRAALKLSVLDELRGEANKVRARLSSSDQQRLDGYLTGVRELEQRIEQGPSCEVPSAPGAEHASAEAHLNAMIDLIGLAFACDLTRVVTLQMDVCASRRSYGFLGVSEAHHNISHSNSPEVQEKQMKVGKWHIGRMARLAEALERNEQLDESLLYFTSPINVGGGHRFTNGQALLVGGGGEKLGGRLIRVRDGRPLADLHLAMLKNGGFEGNQFGDQGKNALDLLSSNGGSES